MFFSFFCFLLLSFLSSLEIYQSNPPADNDAHRNTHCFCIVGPIHGPMYRVNIFFFHRSAQLIFFLSFSFLFFEEYPSVFELVWNGEGNVHFAMSLVLMNMYYECVDVVIVHGIASANINDKIGRITKQIAFKL